MAYAPSEAQLRRNQFNSGIASEPCARVRVTRARALWGASHEKMKNEK